jgi:hypothetical protein
LINDWHFCHLLKYDGKGTKKKAELIKQKNKQLKNNNKQNLLLNQPGKTSTSQSKMPYLSIQKKAQN